MICRLLFEVVIKLIWKDGFGGLWIMEVVKMVGVFCGVLFYYFLSKYVFVVELLVYVNEMIFV